MKTRFSITTVVALVIAIMLTACGASPVAIADLPKFPDATELKPGESRIGDTLQNNMATDASMRQAAGVGGKTEQIGFSLPVETTWDKVKGFYADKLKAAGWSEGMGGIANQVVDVNKMMDVANDQSPIKTTIFSRGNQVLSVIWVQLPTDDTVKELILSLSTR